MFEEPSLINHMVRASLPAPHSGEVVGVVKSLGGKGTAIIQLGLPCADGSVMLTECIAEVDVSSMAVVSGAAGTTEFKGKRFEMTVPFEADEKSATVVVQDKVVVDYLNVTIEGYASTFENVTPRDRDGDAVHENAFDETIADFMANPVMLIDHRNSVHSIAGSFTSLVPDRSGLKVKATLSNAPELRQVRFLVVEKHLRAFSIGGMFMLGGPSGKMIEKVNLFEISLVAVPSNPDALFMVRSLDVTDVVAETVRREKKSPGLLASFA